MQPPKAMGSSLVKMLFHICFLSKIIIEKIIHTNFYGVWGVGGGARKHFVCTLRGELVKMFLYLLWCGGNQKIVFTYSLVGIDLFAP